VISALRPSSRPTRAVSRFRDVLGRNLQAGGHVDRLRGSAIPNTAYLRRGVSDAALAGVSSLCLRTSHAVGAVLTAITDLHTALRGATRRRRAVAASKARLDAGMSARRRESKSVLGAVLAIHPRVLFRARELPAERGTGSRRTRELAAVLEHYSSVRVGIQPSPTEWPGLAVSATCVYRRRMTRSRGPWLACCWCASAAGFGAPGNRASPIVGMNVGGTRTSVACS